MVLLFFLLDPYSPSITELLAWFNLDGYVFEVLPFMNKNLFEILIERQFRPFDVSFSLLCLQYRQKPCALSSVKFFHLWVRCIHVESFTLISNLKM